MASARTLIICGFGSLGSRVAKAALPGRHRSDITIIERDVDRAQSALKAGFRAITGDAKETHSLRVAQTGAARDVIVCTNDDETADVTIAVRRLAPAARIQVGIRDKAVAGAVWAAGADDVLVISSLAGEMLADSISGG